MAHLSGTIRDARNGRTLEARVSVISSEGRFVCPRDALVKRGFGQAGRSDDVMGESFFYSDGSFSVDVPGGPTSLVVERGTEYLRFERTVRVDPGGICDVDIALERWFDPHQDGWYAGNTHVHYPPGETRALERLRLDPLVEDLPILIVSHLRRAGENPASNAFPIGLHALSGSRHVIDIGEEARHNSDEWEIGLGHVMLIRLKELIEPVSTGILVDESSPDYPPLIDVCDSARAQGGTVIWCHNGRGMEAPVAAILGRIDALNIFDPYWMDPEYDVWYRLLSCGIRVPISTGSDWYVCSSNRVYVNVPETFTYDAWLDGLRAGRTFATSGPSLALTVDEQSPSNTALNMRSTSRQARVTVAWRGQNPVDHVELVQDGVVTPLDTTHSSSDGGSVDVLVDISDTTWIAARCGGNARNSFGHTSWAHTSPVYLRAQPSPSVARPAARLFVEELTRGSQWLATKASFADPAQRDRILGLFREASDRFQSIASI